MQLFSKLGVLGFRALRLFVGQFLGLRLKSLGWLGVGVGIHVGVACILRMGMKVYPSFRP